MLAARRTSSPSITRIASVGSVNSQADSFYSVVDSPVEVSSEDQEPKTAHNRCRSRKDSGYSEDRSPTSQYAHSGHDNFDLLELQADLIQLAQRFEKGNRSRRSGKNDDPKDSRQYTNRSCIDVSTPTHRIARKQSSNVTSPGSSIHAKSRGLSRSTSIHSPISAEDPYLVHQKALNIIQTLECSDQSSSSTETTRASSLIRPVTQTCVYDHPMATTSCMDLDTVAETPLSPFYTAANFDWTHPTSRRQAYERHDRGRRGFRGMLKKITPRRWQSEQLDFYDGDSDAGSVRRYRLDLDDSEQQSHRRKVRQSMACFRA